MVEEVKEEKEVMLSQSGLVVKEETQEVTLVDLEWMVEMELDIYLKEKMEKEELLNILSNIQMELYPTPIDIIWEFINFRAPLYKMMEW